MKYLKALIESIVSVLGWAGILFGLLHLIGFWNIDLATILLKLLGFVILPMGSVIVIFKELKTSKRIDLNEDIIVAITLMITAPIICQTLIELL